MNLKEYFDQRHETQESLGLKLEPPVTQGGVSQWLSSRVPAERVIQVERATGGLVSRHELRPDLYPPAESAA